MTNTTRKASSESDQAKDERKGESESPPAEEAGAPSVAGDNWAVEYKEGVGNHVMATRDIEPNEVIIIDRPAVLGPNYETEAVCLECLSRVDGSYLCPECELPLCGERCGAGPWHRPECSVFSRLEKKVRVRNFGRGTVALEYGCIAVIRLLWLRDNDPDEWDKVQLLMDHDEERRRETEYWAMFQRNVVDFMRKMLGLADTYSEQEIHRAIGILRTNAFQVEHPYLAAQGTSGKAIYPTFSFLSHSCMANARYSVDPENKMTIRASWGIKKGEEITIQYISFLFGNSRRREDIKSCWFFECGCPRCSSISELGTNLSAGLCQKPGCQGPVLPLDPGLSCDQWRCGECGLEVAGEQVLDTVRELETEMMDTMETETDKYRAIIDKYSKRLHPNHYQLLLCKRYLAGSMRGQMSLEMVAERLALMTNFTTVFEIVAPGLSKWRGKMLFQISKTRMFLSDIKHSRNELDQVGFIKEIQNNIASMEEVVACLEHEPANTNEWRMAQAARVSLAQARDVVTMISALG